MTELRFPLRDSGADFLVITGGLTVLYPFLLCLPPKSFVLQKIVAADNLKS